MGDSTFDVGDIDISDQPEDKKDAENANNGFVINKEANNIPSNETACEPQGIGCKLANAEEYWTCKRDGAVKIRISGEKDSLTNMAPISVMEYFLDTVNKFPNRPALKVERDGKWITWTYKEYYEEIRTTAKAFIQVR